MAPESAQHPELESFWMPFTDNRAFKANPRLLASAKGMHYTRRTVAPSSTARPGSGASTRAIRARRSSKPSRSRRPRSTSRRPSRSAIRSSSSSRKRCRRYFRRAWTACSSPTPAPKRSIRRSRSRSPITAPSGKAARTRLIGRERGYHGVGFGGISVGGLVSNRRTFTLLPGVDHLPHTLDLTQQSAFTRGPTRAGRTSGRRARGHRGAAWRGDDRRRDRGAGGRIDGRAGAAEGLSRTTARDHQAPRHPSHLR